MTPCPRLSLEVNLPMSMDFYKMLPIVVVSIVVVVFFVSLNIYYFCVKKLHFATVVYIQCFNV